MPRENLIMKERALAQEYRQIPVSEPKPFVKWVGGKRQLMQELENNFPNLSRIVTYAKTKSELKSETLHDNLGSFVNRLNITAPPPRNGS